MLPWLNLNVKARIVDIRVSLKIKHEALTSRIFLSSPTIVIGQLYVISTQAEIT